MQNPIEIAKRIKTDPDKSWIEELEDCGLGFFRDVYKVNLNLRTGSLLVPYIIYAYSPDSPMLNLNKDRLENKEKIFSNLSVDYRNPIIEKIINNDNNTITDVITLFLAELTDWRWPTIFSFFDYHSRMIRYVNNRTQEELSIDDKDKDGNKITLTEDVDISKISKVNREKGEILEQALSKRQQGEKLLSELKRDMVQTDVATQADFGFSFSDTSKAKVDVTSWRAFIRQRNEKRAIAGG